MRAQSALRALARSGLKIGRIGKDYVSNSRVYFFGISILDPVLGTW